VNVSTLLVSQALIQHQDGVLLHPDLFVWEKQLSAYRQQWFVCADKNPLAWYARLCGISPAALLAMQCNALQAQNVQCWVATPYHAQMLRNTVRVLPEGYLPWTAEDALYLCEVLNPFLADDGMALFPVGAALLFVCRNPIEAYPQGFGEISGQMLPDRHHEGSDGGYLNRLLSEIQMILFQHPPETRHERGEADVNGLWLWAPVSWPLQTGDRTFSVATRNPVLQSVVDGRDAAWTITEVERVGELVKGDAALPNRVVLAGDGHAVLLTRSWFPRLRKTTWNPISVKDESRLLAVLKQVN